MFMYKVIMSNERTKYFKTLITIIEFIFNYRNYSTRIKGCYQHKSNNFVAQKQLKEIKNYSISIKWHL